MQASAAIIAKATNFLKREVTISSSPMLISLERLIRNYDIGREAMAEDDAVAYKEMIGKQFKEVCVICEKVLDPHEGQGNIVTAIDMLKRHRRKMGETYQRYVDMEAVSMIITQYKDGRVSKKPEYPNGELYFDHCVYGFLLDLMQAIDHIRFKHVKPQDPAVLSVYNDYLNDAVELKYSDPNPQIMFSNWSRIKIQQREQCVNTLQKQPDTLSKDDEISSGEEMSDDENSSDAGDYQTNRMLHSDPNSKHPFVLLGDACTGKAFCNRIIIAPPPSQVAGSAVSQAPYAPQIGDMFGLWFTEQHQVASPATHSTLSEEILRDKQPACKVGDCENGPRLPVFDEKVSRNHEDMVVSQGTPDVWLENVQQEESELSGTLTPNTLSPTLECDSLCELPVSPEQLPPAREVLCMLSQGSMFESCPHKVDSVIIPE